MAGLFALLSLAFRGGMGVAERVDNQITRNSGGHYPLIPDTDLYYYTDNRGRQRLVKDNRIVYFKSYCPALILDQYGNVVYDELVEKAKSIKNKMAAIDKAQERPLTVYLGSNDRCEPQGKPVLFERKTGRQIARICKRRKSYVPEEYEYGIRYFYDLYKHVCPEGYRYCSKPDRYAYNLDVEPTIISEEYYNQIKEDWKKLADSCPSNQQVSWIIKEENCF